MPVLLNRGQLGHRRFAADDRARGAPKVAFHEADARCIDIGLVNNMSDAALEPTERQVLKLLDAAAEDFVVRLTLYSLPELPRTDLGQRHLKRLHYGNLGNLWNSRLEGLIVTGAEPRAPDLVEESYWRSLAQVFDWADHNTLSTIGSCLAVHAGVLHFDGINRHPLDDKCFGVFEFANVTNSSVMNSITSSLPVPHSRWNEVREGDLTSSGYTILSRSEQAGVDTFIKQKRSLFIFFQGHLEYEAWTLLSEYRRDIERFLQGERERYPSIPQGYFDDETVKAFAALRARAQVDRNVKLLSDISHADISGRLTDRWRPTATRVYRNWLLYLSAKKAERSAHSRVAVRSDV